MARPKPRVGAPLKLLDPEVRDRILTAVRVGNFRSVAARHAGISAYTLMVWDKRGRAAQEARERGEKVAASEEPFLQFIDDMDRAEADAEAAIVADIRRQLPRNPQEAHRFLGVRYRERWGPSAQRVELTGAGGGPVEIVQGFNDHERAALRRAIDSLEIVQVEEGDEVASEPAT